MLISNLRLRFWVTYLQLIFNVNDIAIVKKRRWQRRNLNKMSARLR